MATINLEAESALTQGRLKQLLHYDPLTGAFTRLVWRGGTSRVGTEAGWINQGRRHIEWCGRTYHAHRLAWLYVHGIWPLTEIDHINGDPLDNRIENLRLATRSQNNCNSKRRSDNHSGRKGVSWYTRYGLWKATVSVHGKRKHLGYFGSVDAAAEAYAIAARANYKEFALID